MTTTRTTPRPTPYPMTPRQPGSVPIAVWLSFLWALLHLSLGILYVAGRRPAPWTSAEATVLAGLSTSTVVPAILGLTLVSMAALASGTAARGGAARVSGIVLVAVGLVVALVIGDTRSLATLGYLPLLLLGLVGLGPAAHLDLGLLGSSMLSLSHTVGGLALVLTGLAVLARSRVHSPAAGHPAQRRTTARRVGRWSVAVAVVVPLTYAATRIAWALGIPFGVRDEFLVELGDGKYAGLGLGLFAVVGSLLTLGLVQRWGEVFWWWVPRIGGRSVPVGMAVVPALLVATSVTSAGLGFGRLLVIGDVSQLPGGTADWAAWAPELLWVPWGIALGVAAVSYRIRREADR